jgi:catechol 2,3-dioxygenase-like lactoylglutathione lyase family enzyme
MFKNTKAFSGFAVNDLAEAEKFYGETLGMEVEQGGQGLRLKIAGGNPTFVYAKPDHVPATYTILNFPVDDIDRAVDQLTAVGVTFEHYGKLTDARGIARGATTGGGPDIAWFKDPAGNILSVLEEG